MTQLATLPDDVLAIKNSPELLVLKFGEVFKVADEDERIVEGYASTNDIDEYRDIIEPKAFEAALSRYMQYPMVCHNHDWRNSVGVAEDCKVDSKGLWCRLRISAAEPELWTKIKEKVYRAFSIAGRIVKSEYDDEHKIRRITEIVLYEISIVGLPANRQARIELARSMHGAILSGNINAVQKEGNMPDIDLTKSTPTDVAALVAPEVQKQLSALSKTIGDQIENVTTKAANAAVGVALKDETSDLGKSLKLMNQVLDAQKNAVTKADFDQFKDAVKADFASAAIGYQTKNLAANVSRVPAVNAFSLSEIFRRDSFTDTERKDAAEFGMDPVIYRLQMVDPLQLSGSGQEQVWEFQRTAMVVAMTHTILSKSQSYRGVKSLKCYQRMQRQLDAIKGVAMDTGTAAEGLEWVPTLMNSDLIRRIEIEANVMKLFRRETMPSATWDWPVMGAGASMYVMAQATTDALTALITSSVVGTGKVTLTAVKGGVFIPVATEVNEDSVFAAIPVITDELVLAFRRGLDNCGINGDSDGTHQDTDVQAVTAHSNKLFDGLRKKALAASGSKVDGGGVAVTAANLRQLRKVLSGARAENPADLAFILSASDYINLLSDEVVATVDKFGPDATWLKGVLLALDAIPVVLSDFMRTDVDATGVNGASGNTYSTALCVHRPSWALGDRRQVTVKSSEYILTDQLHLVGTWRGDFKNIKTSNYPVSILYNVQP